MPDFRIRVAEGQDPQRTLLWDSVWKRTSADWALSGQQEGNAGGLLASQAIATSVLIALFTDRRIEDDHPLRYLADGDPRGWWGDTVNLRNDLMETEIGSHLWLLERATLSEQLTKMYAETFAQEALKPLIDQGAVVKVEAIATPYPATGRLDLEIHLYGRDGQKVYAQKFSDLWTQVSR